MFRSERKFAKKSTVVRNTKLIEAQPHRNKTQTTTESNYNVNENLTVPLSGRRVVDQALLASELEKGCTICDKPLRLANVVKEKRNGLASSLFIMCEIFAGPFLLLFLKII